MILETLNRLTDDELNETSTFRFPDPFRRGFLARPARVLRRHELAQALGIDATESPHRFAVRPGHRDDPRIPLRPTTTRSACSSSIS